jgi:dihydrodipicolinate synthase/N-acetylneuraminate lyase
MKEMMALAGLAAGPVRPPLPAVAADDLADLKELFARWREWL